MIQRLIILLLCWKLRVKMYEDFQFTNQKSRHDKYYFASDCLMKIEFDKNGDFKIRQSNVSLNWLLDNKCEIKKVSN